MNYVNIIVITFLVLLLSAKVIAKTSISSVANNVQKTVVFKINGGRSIGPITPHVGVVINNLAGFISYLT